MFIIPYFHSEKKLYVESKIYRMTCEVRNEINKKRKHDEVVKTYPLTNDYRKPYYPRKFPTGLWLIKKPIWTDDIDYAPVKIPTDAFRRVATWDIKNQSYNKIIDHQTDAFYHMHFARDSKTTLGCLRFNSDSDAREVAELIEYKQKFGIECYIEVFANKE